MKLIIILTACIISERLYAANTNVDTIIVQKDTSICSGKSLILSINFPAVTGRIIFPPGSDFEYTFDMPSPGWTTQMGEQRIRRSIGPCVSIPNCQERTIQTADLSNAASCFQSWHLSS